MTKLKMPKNPHKGLKIFCNTCNVDQPKCKHYSKHQYRIRLYVPGTKNKVRTKLLKSREYEGAVIEAIAFAQEMAANNFHPSPLASALAEAAPLSYTLVDAVLLYHQYLDGNHPLAHKKKKVSKAHKDEQIRFCTYFSSVVKKTADITRLDITNINQHHVSDFYEWAEGHYAPKTFNKAMQGVKAFFEFIIDEGVEIKNPFSSYESKFVPKGMNESLQKEEFEAILDAVDTAYPIVQLGGRGERKSMYRPYLKTGFLLALFTGCRREEIVTLKWNQIKEINGSKFFLIPNLKVQRATKRDDIYKYVPIGSDLDGLLSELRNVQNPGADDYILHPNRTETPKTIADRLSKGFAFYRKEAGITKDVDLANLRKTYISWVNEAMGKSTGMLTSHTSEGVLSRHYIDPSVLNAIEKGALEIKIFGK